MYIFSLVMVTAHRENWNNNLNILNSYGMGELDTMLESAKLNIKDGFNYVEGLEEDIGIVKVVISFAETVTDGSNIINRTVDVDSQKKNQEEIKDALIAGIHENIGTENIQESKSDN